MLDLTTGELTELAIIHNLKNSNSLYASIFLESLSLAYNNWFSLLLSKIWILLKPWRLPAF